jgi:hypothetical protein
MNKRVIICLLLFSKIISTLDMKAGELGTIHTNESLTLQAPMDPEEHKKNDPYLPEQPPKEMRNAEIVEAHRKQNIAKYETLEGSGVAFTRELTEEEMRNMGLETKAGAQPFKSISEIDKSKNEVNTGTAYTRHKIGKEQ